MSETAAIYYHPDAYSVDRTDLKGRHAAGAGFLAGLARHHGHEPIYCQAANRKLASEFAGHVQRLAGRPRHVRWLPSGTPANLSEPGCLFVPGPGLAEHAWQRRFQDQRGYSVCGVTHTICTDRVMEGFGQFLLAPVQPWDALIVTSNPARQAILTVLDMWKDYLGSRIGGALDLPIQLPVIPLGVHCDNFAATEEAQAAGRDLRERHGIGASDVVVLFFGRLSFHAKAHPASMFSACELAQKHTQRRIHLMLTGGFPNTQVEQAFKSAAQRLCPSVNTVFVDGNDPVAAPASWSAADLFISLSDNIQETFGLTPVEAMAAGLPAVVSDWDGYRDTVVDGETGYRIPTIVPDAGSGRELAFRYLVGTDNTDRYLGATSQSTVVDIGACAAAVHRLVEDDALRRRMSDAARRRARAVYDWSVVIAAYEELWAELARLRRTAPEVAPCGPGAEPHPLRADPFAVFAGFATRQLADGWTVRSKVEDVRLAIGVIAADPMCNFTAQVFLPIEECVTLAEAARAGCAVRDLVALLPGCDAGLIRRTLMWLAKYDVVVLEPA